MSSVARCVTVIAAALVLMYPRHAQSGAGAEPEKDSAVSAPAATVAEAQQHVAMTLLAPPSASLQSQERMFAGPVLTCKTMSGFAAGM
jgi:hypothetical protein